MISNTDFRNWRQDPVTKTIFELLEDKRSACLERLGEVAGRDSIADSALVGYISAVNDLLQISSDEVVNA